MKIQHWVKHLLVYGTGVLLMNALPFILIPIYTHGITPHEYGVLELLNRSQELLLLGISLGLKSALVTLYQMADRPERRQRLYSTALLFLAGVSAVAVLLLGVVAPHLSAVFLGSSEFRFAVVLMLIATYFESLFQIAILSLQSGLRSTLYVVSMVGRSIFAIALNVLLVVHFKLGLEGILWATVAHSAVAALLMCGITFRESGVGFDRGLLREMLAFGLPLVPGAFAMFILNNGDRYFLNAFVSKEEVGIYGLGYRLGTVATMLVLMPFLKVWSVTMVDLSRAADGPRRLGIIATYLLSACAFTTLGISLFSPYVLELIAPPIYAEAYKLIPIIGAGYIFYSWTVVFDASFYITKRTGLKSLILTLGCIVILFLYSALIPTYGTMGAAWATLGGFMAFAAITGYYAQRQLRIEYEYRRIAFMLAFATLLYLAGAATDPRDWVVGLAVRSALLLSFPGLLWYFATSEEKQSLQAFKTAVVNKFRGDPGVASIAGE